MLSLRKQICRFAGEIDFNLLEDARKEPNLFICMVCPALLIEIFICKYKCRDKRILSIMFNKKKTAQSASWTNQFGKPVQMIH